MGESLLIDNQGQAIRSEKPIPEEWKSGYRRIHRKSLEAKFSNRSVQQLSEDLLAAFDKMAETFDRVADLQKEKNLVLGEVVEVKRMLRWERWKSNFYIALVGGEAVVIGWLVTVVSHALR